MGFSLGNKYITTIKHFKKSLFIAVLCILWGNSVAFSQISYGVRGGINLTSYSGNSISGISNLGFQIGGNVEYAFSKYFGAETGLSILQRNFTGSYEPMSYQEPFSWKTQLYCLRLPAALFFKAGIDDWNARLRLGAFFMYGRVAQDYSLYTNEASRAYFAENSLVGESYFDVGITMGVSFYYSIFSFSIDADLGTLKAFESDRFETGQAAGFFFSLGCNF